MNREDIQKIWSYIKALRPHLSTDRLPRLTKEVATAWASNLTGYSVEEVMQAADKQLAKGSFWPDLSEIMAELPPPSPSRTHLIQSAHASTGHHREDPVLEQLRECFNELERKRREAGIPASYAEAKAAGLTYTETETLWESAGLDYPNNLDNAGGETI